MFAQEREEEIMSVLRKKKAVTVKELSQKLYVSEATVRRDLSRMERTGALPAVPWGSGAFRGD